MKLQRKSTNQKLVNPTMYNSEDFYGTVGQGLTDIGTQNFCNAASNGGATSSNPPKGNIFTDIICYGIAKLLGF